MKAISLIISLTVFMISGYFFVADFKISSESNHIIYMSLLLVLMLICIIGILINMPVINSEKRRMKVLVYDKLAKKDFKSKKFEFGFEPS